MAHAGAVGQFKTAHIRADAWRSALADLAAARARGQAEVDRELRKTLMVAAAVCGKACKGDLEKAMVVLNKKAAVTRVTAGCGRGLYQVAGSHPSDVYNCYNEFCSCQQFEKHAGDQGYFMCKHLLAAGLADALGITEERQVSDEEYAAILMDGTAPLGADGRYVPDTPDVDAADGMAS